MTNRALLEVMRERDQALRDLAEARSEIADMRRVISQREAELGTQRLPDAGYGEW